MSAGWSYVTQLSRRGVGRVQSAALFRQGFLFFKKLSPSNEAIFFFFVMAL
jgi:hypothetical protein